MARTPIPDKQADELGQLRLAFGALERLVRDEYPADKTLAEIVYIWGSGAPEEVEAVRRLRPSSSPSAHETDTEQPN